MVATWVKRGKRGKRGKRLGVGYRQRVTHDCRDLKIRVGWQVEETEGQARPRNQAYYLPVLPPPALSPAPL
eukprot:363254-Chlamydomonas_euryale.AAC.1